MKDLFVSIYRFFNTRKPILFILFFGLLFACAFLASKLKLENDLSAMLPKDQDQKDVSSVLTNNKMLDKIIVTISLKDSAEVDPDILVAFTDNFASLLKERDRLHLIADIETKQNEERFLNIIESVQHNLPFLLDEKDYVKIDSMIQPKVLKSILESNYRTLASPGGVAMKQMISKDPLGISFMALKKLQDVQLDENTTLYDGYIVSANQKNLSFFIHATYPSSKTKENEGLSTLIQSTVDELRKNEEYKNIEFHCFGGQLVASGNAIQMRADTILTLSITIALLLLLFVFFFRSFFAPLQIMIPVLFGGLFGMAMMYILKGHVSMIALGASSVILGIAVNYSLHFLSHFRHSNNKEETIRELSVPMTVGSFTTVFAFLSLSLLHTPVLQELGLFTAFNLIGSSLCTLLFLPHFIMASKNEIHTAKIHQTWLDKLSLYSPNKNKWIVIGICVVTIVLAFFSNNVRFNEDMMKMNYMDASLRESQRIINAQNAASLNSVFCVSEGKTLDEVLQKNEEARLKLERLKETGVIRKFSSIGSFILSDSSQQEKLNRWNQFWTQQKVNDFLGLLKAEGNALGFDASAFTGISEILHTVYTHTDSSFAKP